ncbi:hypothetical protein JYB64_00380 [Algoriphagus aestuarii]|nr:hypothetical protein [Algoriphagus aestuarii]
MQVIKKIGVGSAAKIYGLTLALIGAIIGIPYGLFMSAIIGNMDSGVPFGSAFPIIIIVAIPIVYGLLGFIMGALFAWVYNIVAKKTGGLEIELSEPNNLPAD